MTREAASSVRRKKKKQCQSFMRDADGYRAQCQLQHAHKGWHRRTLVYTWQKGLPRGR